jgi:hypothetical protein
VNQDRPQRSDEAILEFGSGARQTDRALASFGSKTNFAGMAAFRRKAAIEPIQHLCSVEQKCAA